MDIKREVTTEVINEVPNEILETEVYKRFGKQFPLLLNI
jgi:mannose-6-phosphate isomerase